MLRMTTDESFWGMVRGSYPHRFVIIELLIGNQLRITNYPSLFAAPTYCSTKITLN